MATAIPLSPRRSRRQVGADPALHLVARCHGGPTPVSALIHAATMVTAGVYMIVRNHVIFDLSPTSPGCCGTGRRRDGAVRRDDRPRAKRHQGSGVLDRQPAGIHVPRMRNRRLHRRYFHLMTHVFKALLFLSAGSVIHALSGEQDIRKMGGLSQKIPWTHKLFFIGTIAIAGIPPFAGFWSKDEIMAHAFTHHHYVLYGMAAIGALLTSFYVPSDLLDVLRSVSHGSSHSRARPRIADGDDRSLDGVGPPLIAGGFLGFPPDHGWLHQFLAPAPVPAASMKSAPGWSCH